MRFQLKRITAAILAAMSTYPWRKGLALGAVAATLDKAGHEKLPEFMRGWYVEEDGKFNLDPDLIEVEDTGSLKAGLEAERRRAAAAEKAAKAAAEKYKDIDPDKYRELMKQLDEGEEGALLKAGKFEEAFNRRTEKLKAKHAEELKAKDDAIAAAVERSKQYENQVLENHFRAAAAKAKVPEEAVEDVILRARTAGFVLDEHGKAVQQQADGTVVLGQDGKTPFAPGEWMEGLKKTAKHLFGYDASGGGAPGGGPAGGPKGRQVTREQFAAMSPDDQMKTVKDGIKVVDAPA